MGWSGGSSVAANLIEVVSNRALRTCDKEAIYKVLINTLEDHDWDTQEECVGIDYIFDAVLKEMHPYWDWEE